MEGSIILGNKNNYWRWTEEDGFDLTHTDPSTSIPQLKFQVDGGAVTIAPTKTALVIIDMQNYSLALKKHHAGHAVEKALVDHAIPTARRAGIQVIWLNWGLSDTDLKRMPPALQRIFSFGEDGTRKKDGGIGHDMGDVPTEDGSGTVPGGRFLIQGEWNTRLHSPLEALRQHQDVLLYKDRISGMCGGREVLREYLKGKGITTLLHAGINTGFCVVGTMADASKLDFDTILLEDCTGTPHGEVALQASLDTCKKGWGFLSSSVNLCEGLKQMEGSANFARGE